MMRSERYRWAVDLAVFAIAGAFLGLIGPFGSWFNGGWPVRMTYWAGMAALGYAGITLGLRLTGRISRRDGALGWPLLIATILGSTLLLAAISRLVALTLWPFLSAVGWSVWLAQSILVAAFFMGLYFVLQRTRRSVGPAPEPEQGTRILRHLPPKIGRELVCLQMEDHYVRVHTIAGSSLVLLSMNQAIAQLRGIEGQRVHRSWWVARSSVESVIRDGRNVRLRLTNGCEAPVARSAVALLREAGWFDEQAER